ncbi:multicopper oxidase family protein [Nocardia anaemiae]|uniref:multicopper oxidase family protein n=1 Tax=Nocardia anaemiae TaxID=263910 RepID=UPI000AF37720|nr:multicopper oxidase domain-containing protein [Nocardia anaemiae]
MNARITRRVFLGASIATTGIAATGWFAGARLLGPGEPGRLLVSRAPLPRPFQARLPIPPVLEPVRSDATTDYFEITQQVADLDIIPGLRTRAWTYHGTFPGPSIMTQSGRRTVVRHRNELPQPTVVHLHGGHTSADSDGYPMDLIMPTTSLPTEHSGHPGAVSHGQRDYTYPNQQRAATLWYHDHRHGFTGHAVWQGLAGFHLIHDTEEAALPLPTGERDIPMMITDRSFAEDGSFQYPMFDPTLRTHGVHEEYMNGVLGDVILVNGAPWPAAPVNPAQYRLRLLNASNARRYRLELEPQPPGGGGLVQIGSDGGLLHRPIKHDALDIAPAERFDIIVDFARYQPGTQVRLVNRLGTGPTTQIMRFDIAPNTIHDDTHIPDWLSSESTLAPHQATTTRSFHFQLRPDHGWTINGLPYQPGRALARPRLGDTEIWRFVSDFHHPVHVHLNPFQVIRRNTRTPGPFDTGWKDTVNIRPSEAVEIAVRFTDHPGNFMLHCHNLEHEDMSMMADFITE